MDLHSCVALAPPLWSSLPVQYVYQTCPPSLSTPQIDGASKLVEGGDGGEKLNASNTVLV